MRTAMTRSNFFGRFISTIVLAGGLLCFMSGCGIIYGLQDGEEQEDSDQADVGVSEDVDAAEQNVDTGEDPTEKDVEGQRDTGPTDVAPERDATQDDTGEEPEQIEAPEQFTVSAGDHSDYVEVSWGEVDQATGYRIVRDGSTIAEVPAAQTSYQDNEAAEPAPVGNPENVMATQGAFVDRVELTWAPPELTTGTTHYYAVEAFDAEDTARSDEMQGYRGAYPIEGYEVRIDGNEWSSVGENLQYTDHDIQGTQLANIGTAEATQGLEHTVALSLPDLEVTQPEPSSYEIRAYDERGSGPGSTAVEGYTSEQEPDFQWQWAEEDEDQAYQDISDADAQDDVDESAPVDGSSRYYRCKITLGETAEFSGAASGHRQPLQPPSQVTATEGTDDDHVAISWEEVEEADQYRIYRNGTPVNIVNAPETSYDDSDVSAGKVGAPSEVSATTDDHEEVHITWEPPTDNEYEKHEYEVASIHLGEDYESALSEHDVGYAGAPQMTGDYEISIDEQNWIATDADDEHVDEDAPAPELDPGVAQASSGTFPDKVVLQLNGAESVETPVGYRVRALTDGDPGSASETVYGARDGGTLTYQWERSAGEEDTDYSAIEGATSATYEDTEAPGFEGPRYYRCQVGTEVLSPEPSEADEGFVGDASLGTWNFFSYGSTNDYAAPPVGSTLVVRTDEQGNVFVGTNTELGVFDGEEWSIYEQTNSPVTGASDIVADDTDDFWIRSGGRLLHFEDSSWTIYEDDEEGLPGKFIRHIARDGEEFPAVVTRDEGLFRHDGQEWNKVPIPAEFDFSFSDPIPSFIADDDGGFWFATSSFSVDSVIAHYHEGNWEEHTAENSPFDPDDRAEALGIDGDGKTWVGFGSIGVEPLTYDEEDGWEAVPSDSNTPTDVRTLAFDHTDGVVYAGARGSGLRVLTQFGWTSFTAGSTGELLASSISSMDVETNDRLLWMGYESQPALTTLEMDDTPEFNHIHPSTDGLAATGVQTLTSDSEGNIWVGTKEGVSSYDGSQWTTYSHTNSGLEMNESYGGRGVNAIFETSDGSIWIGTEHRGVSRVDGNDWATFKPGNSDLGARSVRAIAEGSDGSIWTGHVHPYWSSSEIGLSRYEGGEWSTYETSDGLAASDVSAVVVDEDGLLWAASPEDGLTTFDGSEWQIVDSSNSFLPPDFDTIGHMEIDDGGSIWFATAAGIFEFHGDDVFDQGDWTAFTPISSALPENEVRDLTIDVHGNIWARTASSVGRLSADGGTWDEISPDDTPLLRSTTEALHATNKGEVWFGHLFAGNHGLIRLTFP